MRSSRSGNVIVSSHGLSDPVLCGKLLATAPDVPLKIFNPPEDVHEAFGGLKYSQLNSNADRDVDSRFYVRAVTRNLKVLSSGQRRSCVFTRSGGTCCEALDDVEMASCDRCSRRTDYNHISLNVIPTVHIDVEGVQKIM